MVFLLPEVISLARCLRRDDVRLVHCNTAWQIQGVLAGKLAGSKVVMHLNDTQGSWLTKVLFGLLGRLSDAYIVAGRRAKERHFTGVNGALARKKIAEIQAPVDTAGEFNPENVTPDPEMFNDGGLNITTVANINPDKGLDDFVGMASALNDRYDNLAFHIVGARLDSQARYADSLSDLVRRRDLTNLRFHGHTNNVASVLKATDVLVCSSLTEASPMAVWEAMAMERAVVSTDVGDVASYLHDGVNGCVAPPGDSSALAAKVGVLIEDEGLRATFGKRARATAIAELDISVCVDKHRSLYIELLADRT
jgi:glycosyltransferase involved in cell wall biosynthesis